MGKKNKEKRSKKQKQKDEDKEKEKKITKRGRPKREGIEEDEDDYNPTYQIKKEMFSYFHKIELRHGLVFSDKEKQKIFDPVPEGQEWDRQTELSKAKRIFDNSAVIIDELPMSLESLCSLFVEIGDVVNAEFSNEIYKFLLTVLKTLNLQDEDEEIDELIQQSYQFSNYINRKAIKKNLIYVVVDLEEGTVREEFQKFFKETRTLFKNIFNKKQEAEEFLKKAQEIHNTLLRIAEQ